MELGKSFSMIPNSKQFPGNSMSQIHIFNNRILRRLKLRGLRQNQMSTPYFIYEIDQPNTINIFGDFENIIPTHIGVAHVFSKIK